jgi:hypothetical protein
MTRTRCPAAHPCDPTPCTGPAVVTVLDATNAGAQGCEHHGARILASLDGGRVYPLPDAPQGAAIRVFKAAAELPPFVWFTRPGTPAEPAAVQEALFPDSAVTGSGRSYPWIAVEPELPACVQCGNKNGPWVHTGDRWPSGAQKFKCAQSCPQEVVA